MQSILSVYCVIRSDSPDYEVTRVFLELLHKAVPTNKFVILHGGQDLGWEIALDYLRYFLCRNAEKPAHGMTI